MRHYGIILLLLLTGLYACESGDTPGHAQNDQRERATLFSLLTSDSSGFDFNNQLSSDFNFNILEYNYFYNGGGVAVGDINRDGLDDLFMAGNMVSSRLYLNRDSLRFEDITAQAGLSTNRWISGVSMPDVNADGWPDIYACAAGYPDASRRRNLLFVNQQDGTFREMAAAYGLDDDGYSTQAAWLDYDRDGDLDMYLLTHLHDKRNPNVPKPKHQPGSRESFDRLYENQGIGPGGHPVFMNVSEQAGIRHEGFGLGVAVDDFNQDGWPDIYVSNDFIFDDLLYINQQDGSFREAAHEFFNHSSRFAMGTDAADFNNDLWPDIFTLDMLPDDNYRRKMMNTAMNYDRFMLALERGYLPQFSRNTLQMNNGRHGGRQLAFSEIGQMAEIYQTDWSWSALWADYDNNGRKDLLITNGIPKDITDSDFIKFRDTKVYAGDFDYDDLKRELLQKVDSLPGVDKSNFIFRNDGQLGFTDMTRRWGLSRPSYSNGAVFSDLDNDGDLDLVINNIDAPAFLYRNHTRELHENPYLQIRLEGPKGNPAGIGSRLVLEQGGQRQYHYLSPSRGFQSWTGERIHLGLATDSIHTTLSLIWPDGRVSRLEGVSADTLLTLRHEDAEEQSVDFWQENARPLFEEMSRALDLSHSHQENPFADFKLEPLLPHKLSQNGPGLAVADLNGDGLDDFWTGGAHQQPGHIFLQQADGRFQKQALPDENFEDVGGLFFDADGDGDTDLYVVSGGNEFNANTAAYQDRLYFNDGNGNFTRNKSALPRLYASGSCVSAADYDRDGDLDLFVGGRLSPARYPLTPRSYLLRNEGGSFRDVTDELAPALAESGMVSAALWTDYDDDGLSDLLLCGEWMPVRVFKNVGGQLEEKTGQAGLANSRGWWNSLIGDDFDQDGDTDYIVGNLGLNTPLKASPSRPLKIVADDFDRNGSVDALLSYHVQGLEVPYIARDPLVSQLVMMRKRFPSYHAYAEAGMHEVLKPQERSSALTKKAEVMTSSYLENLGNGRFAMKALPAEAQIAPLYGMQSGDFNGDGIPDLLAHGNSYATEFVTGQYDALRGLLLLGQGRGRFEAVKPAASGFVTNHDGTAMSRLKSADGRMYYLLAANNDSLRLLRPMSTDQNSLRAGADIASALITYENGRVQKKEFYRGEGYLSQSSRHWTLPGGTQSVRLVSFTGDTTLLRP